jgi:tetratricopeptide (TPR) repeat protein
LEEYQKAIADCDRVIKLNPNKIKAYLSRGVAYSKLREYEKGIKDLQQAAELFQKQGDNKNHQKVNKAIKKLKDGLELYFEFVSYEKSNKMIDRVI